MGSDTFRRPLLITRAERTLIDVAALVGLESAISEAAGAIEGINLRPHLPAVFFALPAALPEQVADVA